LLEAEAVVEMVRGDFVYISVYSNEGCKGCGKADACHTADLASLFGKRNKLVQINNDFDATTGERIVVGIQERALLQASFLAYVLPIIIMIIVAVSIKMAGLPDIFAAIGAMAGLVLGLVILHLRPARLMEKFRVVFLRR
jgi:sigma-E factor negative regulatory protein RseC